MNLGVSSIIGRAQEQNSSVKFLRLAHLRKLRRCEQVAAICFRVRGGDIEFLLVQTRKGRWIFPKGGAEPGLTHAQAAALEAFEEAGVHGRMEEVSFTSYVQRKRSRMRRVTELSVSAHLCEVLRLVPPPELNRNPTWFSAGKAKRRLCDDRASDHGTDLARVIDRAVTRIQRLRRAPGAKPEAQPGTPPTTVPSSTTQSHGTPDSGAQAKAGRQKARLIDIDSARGKAGRSRAASAG
jgi:8-oxo-dGTP pyrophosphatase MutT (NUDIX family)